MLKEKWMSFLRDLKGGVTKQNLEDVVLFFQVYIAVVDSVIFVVVDILL
jgi:hypothetical protein